MVKVGSALLTDDGRGIDESVMHSLVEQITALREQGSEVLLVSSGAVAAGLLRLGWSERPRDLHELQAAAAIGQSSLVQRYEHGFARRNVLTAQILLSHDDVVARDRYLNARGTLNTLLSHGVLPIINENDTVVTEEIRFGDNDTLAALVANLIDADVLALLTDQSGLYQSDPREDPDALMIEHTLATDPGLDAMVGDGGRLGRGGMLTKLRAARLASRSGTQTLIANGREEAVLTRLASGEGLGSWLESVNVPENARRQWLASLVTHRGTLEIDDGAVSVLRESGRSLLPVGVRSVSGEFNRGDLLLCRDCHGREVARGLSNYAAHEARRIIGRSSQDIPATLGYGGEPELIHRDNMVLL